MIKLNLGCGYGKKDGWVNCDILPDCKPDVLLDLEKPLPFESDSVDAVDASHVFEHIHNFVELMIEIHRVLKDGGVLYACVPLFPCKASVADPDHCRFFVPETFDMFCDPARHLYFKGAGLFNITDMEVETKHRDFFTEIRATLRKTKWIKGGDGK